MFMSSEEVVGLMLTVALLSATAGTAVTAAVILRRSGMSQWRMRRVDAYARWLAAWMTLSRVSASFVAAFRALATERRDSEYFALRRHEAQRARAAWSDAMRELDRAEAALIAGTVAPSIRAGGPAVKRASGRVSTINTKTRTSKRGLQDSKAKAARSTNSGTRSSGPSERSRARLWPT